MELRHLRYFLAVAEHQSFRKAAQALRLSHPSLCAQIIDLEQEVGTRLFERTNRQVCLTEPGHTFLAGARRTLKCAIQTLESTQQASRRQSNELRIANIGLICSSLLAHLIRAFRERYPKVPVSILQRNNVEGIEAALGKVELCIGYRATEPKRQRIGALESWIIATAPVGVAVGATFGRNNNGPARLRDFANEAFLILDPKYAPGYFEWVHSIFQQTHFEPAEVIMVDSTEGFFTLLSAGTGVALLSPLHFEGRREGFCFRKISETIADFPLSLMWNAKRTSPVIKNFLEVVKQVLSMRNGAPIPDEHGSSLCARDEHLSGLPAVERDTSLNPAPGNPDVSEV
jgi:DNA-binding transcriptional LysR family regulator